MNDKNGIEIKCENCAYQNICSNFGDSDYNNATLEFVPTTNALESRIAVLTNCVNAKNDCIEAYKSRKPRAKRLSWVDELTAKKEYSESKCFEFTFKVEKMLNYDFWEWSVYFTPDLYVYDNCKNLQDGKNKAQEWLDRLVEECAEMTVAENATTTGKGGDNSEMQDFIDICGVRMDRNTIVSIIADWNRCYSSPLKNLSQVINDYKRKISYLAEKSNTFPLRDNAEQFTKEELKAILFYLDDKLAKQDLDVKSILEKCKSLMENEGQK